MTRLNIKQVPTTSTTSRKLASIWQLPPTWLRFLIVALLVLGVFFRFVNLDRKIYWVDETYSSLRIAGYLESELVHEVSSNSPLGIKNLQKYQGIVPEKGLADTVRTLAVETPEHPPLYYVFARFWMQLFGNSIAAARSSAAIISFLALPCMYWLCMELFELSFSVAEISTARVPVAASVGGRGSRSIPEYFSGGGVKTSRIPESFSDGGVKTSRVPGSLVGWLAVALMAVSPFHLLYAQEFREYSTLALMTLLSSACLLRAMRKSTLISWSIYAATIALGLYSYPYVGFVAIGHGIYVVASERFRWSKAVKNYLLASVAAIVAFSPWIIVTLSNLAQLDTSIGWQTRSREPLMLLVRKWVVNLSRVFVDFGMTEEAPKIQLIALVPLILLSLVLVGYSIYFLCRHAPKKVWLFVVILIGVTALALILPDVIKGGRRSIFGRYMTASYLGVQIAVAYLIAAQLASTSVKVVRQKMWQVAAIAIFSVGVLSCSVSSQADVWWTKYTSPQNFQLAKTINESPRPLLISATKPNYSNFTIVGNLISLSYLLDPKVQLQVVVEPNIPKIPDGFSDVFLLLPTKEWRSEVEKQYNAQAKLIYSDKMNAWLWKLEKQ